VGALRPIYRLTGKHFEVVVIFPEKEFRRRWGAILKLETRNLGKEWQFRLLSSFKFQISSFLESHSKNLFGNRTSKAPQNIFLKAILADLNPIVPTGYAGKGGFTRI